MSRKTVCLNMIVKDEAHVIRRCLDSVRPFIDSWVIVDTGSTDGTQDAIREILRDLPGTLFERTWKDFAHNRSEALELAKTAGDYLLFIDADDYLVAPPDFQLPPLAQDAYEVLFHHNAVRYLRLSLVRSALPWSYVGVVHAVIHCAGQTFTRGRLNGPYIQLVGDGARSKLDPKVKYGRNAAILERALQDDPENTRYWFYLAESYRDAREPEQALATYDRRAKMGGFREERYCALLQAARLARQLERPPAEIVERFLSAYEFRPTRAEALGELASYMRQAKRWPLALLFAGRAIQIPMPSDILFVEPAWYEWRCLDEYSIAAYWTGDYETARSISGELLSNPHLPPSQRQRVLGNLNFALQKLGLPQRSGAG